MTLFPDLFVLEEFSWSSSLVLLVPLHEGSLVTEASISPILFYTFGLTLNSVLGQYQLQIRQVWCAQVHLQSLTNCKYSNRDQEKISRLVLGNKTKQGNENSRSTFFSFGVQYCYILWFCSQPTSILTLTDNIWPDTIWIFIWVLLGQKTEQFQTPFTNMQSHRPMFTA